MALSDLLFQLLVGGGDDPHVQRDIDLAANPANLLFLNGPQQLGLHGHVHFADLIQKDRTTVGRLEHTQLTDIGTGETPLFMPEQLTLDQGVRYGGAVDGHERFVAALAPFMDGTCHQLLAGP